jgi:ABC-2 type transport system ATP-binding protein
MTSHPCAGALHGIRTDRVPGCHTPVPTMAALPGEPRREPVDVGLQDLPAAPAASTPPGHPVIRAAGVVKRWGATTALDGATFDVPPGITGLLGPNGAGKTTLLGMILGLHRPTAGTLEVLGLDPAHAGPEIRARVGYSPELHTLPDDMRAHDLVRHIAEVHGLPRREATARASDVIWQVGLGEERFRPIGTMSTGQRQRVKLAQAIAHDPALVLLDEPTDGLDPVQRDDMLALIRRIGTEFGISVLLSSHLLEEVERVCDHAVIVGNRRIVASGRLQDLTRRTDGIIVEVTDGLAELVVALRVKGVSVDVEDHRLLVRSLSPPAEPPVAPDDPTSTRRPDIDDAWLADVVRDALVDSGAGLRRMAPRRVTLEEVYMEVGS